MAATTKDRERKALGQIRQILGDLGEDSYVGAALDGCLDLAEYNIENDFSDSWKRRWERAEKDAEKAKQAQKLAEEASACATDNMVRAQREARDLKEQLDKELMWHDCDGGTTMRQSDYEKLRDDFSTKHLTDDEAREKLSDEFGFQPERITISYGVEIYEADKYYRMRPKEKYIRRPMYNSTDWNYIRFNCAGWQYEMVNGDLRPYET